MPLEVNRNILSQLISGSVKDIRESSFSEMEWHLLAQKAYSEGVASFLYRQLSQSENFASVPEETRDFLRRIYIGTSMQNHLIFKELEILTRLFHEVGIAVVALKGISLALTVYPDMGLRPMGDIDLLIPKEKLTKAVEIAKSLDYQITIPEASAGLRDLLNHEICLQKSGNQPVILELHHSLVADKTYSYAVPVDWFWGQTETLVASSKKHNFENLLMLKPEAQILYASSHAMLQQGGSKTPLRWFYDGDRLIRHYKDRINWDLLLSQAKIFEWGSALNAFLEQTKNYFDTPIPDYVLNTLSKVSDPHQRIVTLKQKHPDTHTLAERQTLLSLNLYGRFRFILALLIPSPAYMRWRYGLKSSWLLPFYYIFRWWGILKDAIRTIFTLFQTRLGKPAKSA